MTCLCYIGKAKDFPKVFLLIKKKKRLQLRFKRGHMMDAVYLSICEIPDAAKTLTEILKINQSINKFYN